MLLQVEKTFDQTPLPRCDRHWAVEDLIKQYWHNLRAHKMTRADAAAKLGIDLDGGNTSDVNGGHTDS
jgi:hypothetical protein